MIEQLLSLADDPNPYARIEAIERLHLWRQDPKAAAALKTAVHDEIWLVRRTALGLGYGDARRFDRATGRQTGRCCFSDCPS
ncbi:MAG: HEAT repeat domain-containing protein [Candidatus Manganitrophus sp.]|nr:HEAT repeat domain-containing protein [Candidatus Manganitrophus sp.]